MRLKVIKPSIATLSGRSIPMQPRERLTYIDTPSHRLWAQEVKRRARYECERCGRRDAKMFADHIVEVKDGGDLLSLGNGQCLCGSCHTSKTVAERGKRAFAKG